MAGKRKSNVPKDETQAQKLVRLATMRTVRLIKGVGNLAKLSRLKPTSDQTEKVFGAIKQAVDAAYDNWKGQKSEAQEFKL